LIVVERLLLFLFCCLLRFLRLLRFLGHVPLRNPKAQCKSTIDRHRAKVHQNCKIDTARSKEGKRRRDSRPGEGLRDARTQRVLLDQDRKKFLRGRKTKPTAAKPNNSQKLKGQRAQESALHIGGGVQDRVICLLGMEVRPYSPKTIKAKDPTLHTGLGRVEYSPTLAVVVGDIAAARHPLPSSRNVALGARRRCCASPTFRSPRSRWRSA
jgi:hypothetical protein